MIEHIPGIKELGEKYFVEEKQPLGIVPRQLHEATRTVEICRAVVRYLKNGKRVPRDWAIELNELLMRNSH